MQMNTTIGQDNNYSNYQKALYSPKGYHTLSNYFRFLGGSLVTYGVLETTDKFRLSKNKKNRTAEKLTKLAKRHTKFNVLLGVLGGLLSVYIGKYFDKKTLPFFNKMYDKSIPKQQNLVNNEQNNNSSIPVDKSEVILNSMKK